MTKIIVIKILIIILNATINNTNNAYVRHANIIMINKTTTLKIIRMILIQITIKTMLKMN